MEAAGKTSLFFTLLMTPLLVNPQANASNIRINAIGWLRCAGRDDTYVIY
jgi:hypothetical protein